MVVSRSKVVVVDWFFDDSQILEDICRCGLRCWCVSSVVKRYVPIIKSYAASALKYCSEANNPVVASSEVAEQ